jgi:excisionase family DNA binding protein
MTEANMNWKPEPLVYTVEESLDILRMSRDRFYRFIRDGNIKALKAGRRTLIPASELQRFVDELPTMKTTTNN